MQLFLWAEDAEAELRAELSQAFPAAPVRSEPGAVLASEFVTVAEPRLPHLVYARQWLADAELVRAESIRAWAEAIAERTAGILPDDQPWGLHIEPHYGVKTVHRMGARAWHTAQRSRSSESGKTAVQERSGEVESSAGRHRCRLIREAVAELLRKRRRHLLRRLRSEPAAFTPADSLVQVLLTSPEAGYVSVCRAPVPAAQSHLISAFPKGEVAVASDPLAPSRAFAKLVEAEQRMGRGIGRGATCVDLGASPGSWTYVAVQRGANVVAVDRSELREDLMSEGRVRFQRGDAFRFEPERPVDWLLCDVIAPPERSAELLVNWLRRRWCRQFVVTLKLRDTSGQEVLGLLKRELPQLSQAFWLTRLSANKKEVCAFGWSGPDA
jgi:23S rRNA (cytidine2498-2'-O)-methyltransferase